jgi:hypothetical protein
VRHVNEELPEVFGGRPETFSFRGDVDTPIASVRKLQALNRELRDVGARDLSQALVHALADQGIVDTQGELLGSPLLVR